MIGRGRHARLKVLPACLRVPSREATLESQGHQDRVEWRRARRSEMANGLAVGPARALRRRKAAPRTAEIGRLKHPEVHVLQNCASFLTFSMFDTP